MVDAAGGWSPLLDRPGESSDGQARVYRPTDGVADHTARPGIENHCEVDEAGMHRDIGDVGDPELIRAGRIRPQLGCRSRLRE